MKEEKMLFKLKPLHRKIGEYLLRSTGLFNSDNFMGNKRGSEIYHNLFFLIYDLYTLIEIPRYHKIIDILVEKFVPNEATVLDMCCGTGNLTIKIALNAKKVVGLDSSKGMLSKAKRKAAKYKRQHSDKEIDFIHGDITKKLEFPDSHFDLVTAGFSFPVDIPMFQHKQDKIINEVYRVLKKTGSVVILQVKNEVSDMYFSKEGYYKLLYDGGFKDVEIEDIFDLYVLVHGIK